MILSTLVIPSFTEGRAMLRTHQRHGGRNGRKAVSAVVPMLDPLEGPAADARPQPAAPVAGRPTLQWSASADGLHFVLRSSAHSRLLAGGPWAAGVDADAAADRIRQLCADEKHLVIAAADAGHEIHLQDDDGQVLARSQPVASRALADALRKLIHIQGRRAVTLLQGADAQA